MPNLIGTAPNQVPTNGSLGSMAFQNKTAVSVDLLASAAGSATAPAITLNGNTNTGIFSPASNTYAFTTNGAERMRIDSAGNVGIGVTPSSIWSAAKAIQVSTGFTAMADAANGYLSSNSFYNGTNYVYITTQAASRYDLTTAGHKWYTAPSGTAGAAVSFTQAMTLDSAGRFLVGTTTGVGTDFTSIRFNSAGSYPQGLNMVDSNASASGTTFQVFRKSDDTYLGNIRRNSTDNAIFVGGNSYLALGSGDTERMRIDSSGNLGVGITNPSAGRIVVRTASTTGKAFAADNTANTGFIVDFAPNITSIGNDFNNPLAFLTNATEWMRITAAGDVGIGTTGPTAKLDVNADTVRVRTARTPASSTATGNAGDICWDSSYIYVCVATNTWKRSALSTW